MLKGIDISGVQVISDIDKLRENNLSFALIKGTEGTGYVNPKLQAQVYATHAAGMLNALYLFFHPEMDAKAQGYFFLNQWKLFKTDLPPIIDIEFGLRDLWPTLSPQQRIESVSLCLKIMKDGTGRDPIIYTSNYFYNTHINNVGTKAIFGGYRLWLAQYEVNAPTVPVDWQKWDFWQYGTSNTLSGINNVDVDVFNGTIDELKAL